jgi:serine/threonine protein kinase
MYAAADRNLPREVATKLLSPKLVRFRGYGEQFAREAQTVSQLQHPHICRVLDSGQARIPMGDGTSAETYFLCFELMAGGNLAERLEKLSGIGLDQMNRWIEMLGSALNYAHEQGVIHGDLKPTAVVFDVAEHLYLTDFAIAQQALNPIGRPYMGSPAYIAPEQWETGAVSPATDQFAFAVIAYYLIAGSKPYEGLDHPEIRAQQFRRGPEEAHEMAARNGRPFVQRVVSDVLRRGLSTSAADRFATVEQFTLALNKALVEGRRIGDTPQVFISYDREQSGGWVRFFGEKLKEKHGIRVFMDTMGLDRAGRFPPRLAKAIEDCDVFVCFLAGTTLTSKWVNEEIRLAHEHHKLMIPVFQESYVESTVDAENPVIRELISHQGIKLFDIGGHYVDHAVADLADMIKGTTSSA